MARRTAEQEGPSGLLVVDKPAGLTSHDVVARMRRIAGTRRVGHAGTLDPMATGVLILGVNQATKLLTWITGESKTYRTTIRLGFSTVTDDAEGERVATADADAVAALTEDTVLAGMARLTGPLQQVPSSVSAVKVDGVRSYARVRSGQEVALAPRSVTVHSFRLEALRRLQAQDGTAVLDLDATVSCSSGTYVRALARDLGRDLLGVAGHLTALRRTAVGEVGLEDAQSVAALAAAREAGQPLPLLGLEQAAARLFATRRLDAQEATDLSNGRWIRPSAEPVEEATAGGDVVPAEQLRACFAPDGTLVALARDQVRRGRPVAAPHLVFVSGATFHAVSPQEPTGQEPADAEPTTQEEAR